MVVAVAWLGGSIDAQAWQAGEFHGYALSLEGYLRNDVVSWKNVVDLDSANHSDSLTYEAVSYSLALRAQRGDDGPQGYLKLERNGPYDYGTPLWVSRPLLTSDGEIDTYRDSELLPSLAEFWADLPLAESLRLKAGLYTYDVGNGFSLHGCYETYGATLYQKLQGVTWRMQYARPDYEYKIRRGPRLHQELDQGQSYQPNAANFFAADVKFEGAHYAWWPYVGVLADYTSPGKRDSVFEAPIKRDILGTVGLALSWQPGNWQLLWEGARNFGQAESADPAYKDIVHQGFLVYQKAGYTWGRVTPSAQFLLVSGNKVSLDDALQGRTTLAGGRDQAFSVYPAANKNLADSISCSNSEARPLVMMGNGWGINYGLPRPETFAAADYDNLLLPGVAIEVKVTPKLSVQLYQYYARSYTPGAGLLNGEAKRLSAELGYETDCYIDYQFPRDILASLSFGYFIPGRYYKEQRDDSGGSLLSPFIRGDGAADPAYQIELSLEMKF